MKQFDFTVIGTAATVTVLKVDEMPRKGCSTAVLGGGLETCENGGMGFNICAGLTKLGASVYPVLTYTDRKQGKYLHEFAETYCLPQDGIMDPPEDSKGTTIMIQDRDKSHMTLITEYERRMPESTYFPPQKMEEHFFNSRMAILTAPMAVNTGPALEAVRRAGIPLCLSMRKDALAFPEKLLREAVCQAELIFANEDETHYLEELMEVRSVEELLKRGRLKHYIETLGAAGSRVFSLKEGQIVQTRVQAVAPRTKEPETIGAGDGYVSGFMYGYINGKDIRICAAYGSSVSSFVLEKEGSITNLPSREQMLERC